jgi:putative Ca2+/H+ antiporter (TMEM165/GDT1 family)
MTMDWKMFLTVFGTVFLAELGDKTQLATMLFAAKGTVSLWTIFLAAAGALVLTSAIGVAAGAAVAEYVNPKYLSYAAGIGFILIGAWTVYAAAAAGT